MTTDPTARLLGELEHARRLLGGIVDVFDEADGFPVRQRRERIWGLIGEARDVLDATADAEPLRRALEDGPRLRAALEAPQPPPAPDGSRCREVVGEFECGAVEAIHGDGLGMVSHPFLPPTPAAAERLLAVLLHDAMCRVSHHDGDGTGSPCFLSGPYRGISAYVTPRLLAHPALADTLLRGLGAGRLEEAAVGVLIATDALRDARNGHGHPGEAHDHVLGDINYGEGRPHVCSSVDDCAGCRGAQYGTEDGLHMALGQLRLALGLSPRPWEAPDDATWKAAMEPGAVYLPSARPGPTDGPRGEA